MAESANSSTLRNGVELLRTLEFQEQSQSLASILEKRELPIVMKYDKAYPLEESLVTSDFDPNIPLLVYSQHDVKQFRGRCVRFQKDSCKFMDDGCDTIVAETYQGWFGVLGNPNSQTREPVIPHYRRISQLAISTCTKFLVSGDRPLSALLLEEPYGEQINFEPTQIQPGTELQKGHLFSTCTRVKVKKKFRKKEKTLERKYMSAKDSNGHTLFIPCESEGLFYVLATNSNCSRTTVPILKADEILQRRTFPLLVKLVHGRVLHAPDSFNGTFVILSSDSISSVMACSIRPSQNYPTVNCFEISQNTHLPFLLSTPTEKVTEECKNIIHDNKEQLDLGFQCIRFQNKSSQSTNTGESNESHQDQILNFTDPTLCSTVLLKRLDVSSLNNNESTLYPPSPVSSHSGELKISNSTLSYNRNQIKQTVTYNRPKDLAFDVIPIKQGRENDETTSTYVNINICLDQNRPYSESVASSSSSTSQPGISSQPSLSDSASDNGELDEESMTSSHDEFSESGIYVNINNNELEELSDSSQNYYSIWNNDSSKKSESELEIVTENDQRSDENNKSEKNKKCKIIITSVDEDENGYVVASELTNQPPRPASHVGLTPHEPIYDAAYVTADFLSPTALQPDSNRESIASSGSLHVYVSLEDVIYDEVADNDCHLKVPTNSGYVNLNSNGKQYPDYETISSLTYRDFVNKQMELKNKKESQADGQKTHPKVPPRPHTEYLLKPSSRNGGSNLSTHIKIPPSGVYVNMQTTSDESPRHRDLLQRLSKQDLKRTSRDALEILNERDVLSIIEAEDQVERLKELLPEISRSDVFKIGLCLKGL